MLDCLDKNILSQSLGGQGCKFKDWQDWLLLRSVKAGCVPDFGLKIDGDCVDQLSTITTTVVPQFPGTFLCKQFGS